MSTRRDLLDTAVRTIISSTTLQQEALPRASPIPKRKQPAWAQSMTSLPIMMAAYAASCAHDPQVARYLLRPALDRSSRELIL